MRDFLFTSESVSEGHPDKVADQISDTVLDYFLSHDPYARVACETLVNTDLVVLAGEISSSHQYEVDDITALVRETIKEIGYNSPAPAGEPGFDHQGCEIMWKIDQQSQDIAMGVNEGTGTDKEQGAGDQGLMFGYACTETDALMPMPIEYAHRLVRKQAELRKSGQLGWLRPDAKSQVTVQYVGGKPALIDTIVLSTQHHESMSQESVAEAVREEIIKACIPAHLLSNETKYLINPTGRFVTGGPVGDCGLTGRKIIVDTYGGAAHHGGGAFSGKDPTKVDRSAAYAGRYVAKNVVAAGLAEKCEVQVAYAIGVAKPVSVMVNTFGTAHVDEAKIEMLVAEHFKLRPKEIIETLELLRPIYRTTAAYGHFGRSEPSFTWERTDMAELLRSAAGLA